MSWSTTLCGTQGSVISVHDCDLLVRCYKRRLFCVRRPRNSGSTYRVDFQRPGLFEPANERNPGYDEPASQYTLVVYALWRVKYTYTKKIHLTCLIRKNQFNQFNACVVQTKNPHVSADDFLFRGSKPESVLKTTQNELKISCFIMMFYTTTYISCEQSGPFQ